MPISNDDLLNKPSIFMPEDTVIEKELNKRLQHQFDDKRDINKILEQSLIIATLLAHQNQKVSRDFIQKILPKIKEEVEIQASNRASVKVLVIKLLAAAIEAAASGYGAYGTVNAINTYGLEKAGNVISSINSETGVAKAIGSAVSSGGDFYAQSRQGDTDIRQYAIEEMKRHRDLNQQSGQAADSKETEHLRNLQQSMQAAHHICSQILGQSGG
jgi:hypothetical protein